MPAEAQLGLQRQSAEPIPTESIPTSSASRPPRPVPVAGRIPPPPPPAGLADDLLRLMEDSYDILEFTVMKEEEYQIKQLRDRSDLLGKLYIFGLQNVESKEEALEANLAAKERLTALELCWDRESRRPNVEAEAQVMEGLCPPAQLEHLEIWDYHGSRYPSWMVGTQNGGPKELERIFFWRCSQLGPAPRLENFVHLQLLWFSN